MAIEYSGVLLYCNDCGVIDNELIHILQYTIIIYLCTF